jgi:hypothetical protein
MTERVDEWVQRMLLERDIPWENVSVGTSAEGGYIWIIEQGIHSRPAWKLPFPAVWPAEAASLASSLLRQHRAMQRKLLGLDDFRGLAALDPDGRLDTSLLP